VTRHFSAHYVVILYSTEVIVDPLLVLLSLICCQRSGKRPLAKKASKDSNRNSSDLAQLVSQVPTSQFDLAQFVVAMGIIRRELRYVDLNHHSGCLGNDCARKGGYQEYQRLHPLPVRHSLCTVPSFASSLANLERMALARIQPPPRVTHTDRNHVLLESSFTEYTI